jgi:site-specific DNA recombinase
MKDNSFLPKNVGIWIRVSTEDQARGDSPDIHESRAKAYAAARGWTVREVYDLAGVSGKSVMEHPEARRMMADVKRGHITPQGFGEFYKPAEERLNQLLTELPKLQAQVDLMKVSRISAEDVMAEANSLYAKWPSLPLDDRRKIAEAVCEKIVIGNGEIDITLSHLPTSEELCKNQTRL